MNHLENNPRVFFLINFMFVQEILFEFHAFLAHRVNQLKNTEFTRNLQNLGKQILAVNDVYVHNSHF